MLLHHHLLLLAISHYGPSRGPACNLHFHYSPSLKTIIIIINQSKVLKAHMAMKMRSFGGECRVWLSCLRRCAACDAGHAQTILHTPENSFFPLIASLKAYLIKQTCEVVVTLTKTPKRRVDQNTFSLNFIGSPNYYPMA